MSTQEIEVKKSELLPTSTGSFFHSMNLTTFLMTLSPADGRV